LTQDTGIIEITQIGKSTLSAKGEYAPVVIEKGTLHNANSTALSLAPLGFRSTQYPIGDGQGLELAPLTPFI
jgi:hypothetical protein